MPNTRELELWRLVNKAFQNSIEKFGDIFAKDVTRDLLANGVAVQQWIPVTERLPQEDLPFGALCEVVQVLLNDGSVTIGWCNRGLRLWFHMPIRETKIVGYEYEKTPVIAWQPLSQPPSGAKNE